MFIWQLVTEHNQKADLRWQTSIASIQGLRIWAVTCSLLSKTAPALRAESEILFGMPAS